MIQQICWNGDVKLDVYILGINKLKTTLVDLSILRDVVKHDVFKGLCMINWLKS